MLYGMYLSASGMMINQHRQDVVANNLANVNTPAFKRSIPIFKERLQEALTSPKGRRFLSANLKSATGGLFVSSVYTDFTPSQIKFTNRKLDVTINGSGFFMIKDGDQIRYTRDGRFSIRGGLLVRLTDGKPVLDADGREIGVGEFSISDIKIDSEGYVRAKGYKIGRLGVVDFADKSRLRHLGKGLYQANGATPQRINPILVPEAIESSSVNPAYELVEMIKSSRNFAINAQMLSMQDETLGRLINQVTRLI